MKKILIYKSIYITIITIIIFIMLYSSCSDSVTINEPEVQNTDGKIFIVDNTGKRWDVTHAVQNYGFNANQFQFGLGPFAITPILTPQHISPEEPGYPPDSDMQLVIGTTLNDDTRAYPINVLTSHEIVDESFGDTHVAVAY